jgi:hypothetical protein
MAVSCSLFDVESPGLMVFAGGYGQGSSQQDLTYIINENGNNFVGVTIQYRVGDILN